MKLIGWVTSVVRFIRSRDLGVANHFVMSGNGHRVMVLCVVVKGVLSWVKKENSSSSRVVMTSVRCQNSSSAHCWGVVVAVGMLVQVVGSRSHFSNVVCVICVASSGSRIRTPCCHTEIHMWCVRFGRCFRNSRGFWEGGDEYSILSSESYSGSCGWGGFIVV